MLWTKRHSQNAVAGSFVLYCLCESGRKGVRYFGITKQQPAERMAAHIRDVKIGETNYKTRWLKSVLDRGGEISMRVLAVGLSETEATRLERGMIALFKNAFRLTNTGSAGLLGGKPRKFKPDITIRIYYGGEMIYRKAVKHEGKKIISANGRESKRTISREIEKIITSYALDETT